MLCMRVCLVKGDTMNNKKEVIKASAAVQIQNNMTLLQRRAWNILLAHAYDELPTEEWHHIGVHDLMQVLEFHSKNEDYLKDALEALVVLACHLDVRDGLEPEDVGEEAYRPVHVRHGDPDRVYRLDDRAPRPGGQVPNAGVDTDGPRRWPPQSLARRSACRSHSTEW